MKKNWLTWWHRGLRRAAVALSVMAVVVTGALTVAAQESGDGIRFFRIGTGSTSGTYFPVGGIIASAISNPPGSRACGKGGSCDVPGSARRRRHTSRPLGPSGRP